MTTRGSYVPGWRPGTRPTCWRCRRSCAQPEQWQAYLVWGPQACDVPTLVRIAGSRWRIEAAFEMAKQEVGLDEYEVRNARGWDRHMILALHCHYRRQQATTL
ncbi:MAG: hypothetical protein OXG36_14990 [Caldilineaceae bacterium]|nr:hypothetical protein [Caldilineaceae bacterium]